MERGRGRMPRWSVRSRILATVLMVTAISMLAAGAVTYLVERGRILHEIDVRLTAHVAQVRLIVVSDPGAEGQGYSRTTDALRAVIGGVLPGAHESSIGIVDGTPAYTPAGGVPFRLDEDLGALDRMIGDAAEGKVKLGTLTSSVGHLRYLVVPVTVGDGVAGVYVAAIDIDGELGELGDAVVTYLGVAAGALLVIGLVGWLVSGRLLAPVRSLRIAAERITGSDRSERIPVVGTDDISDLTRTVNEMLDRLDSALTAQQHLLDDVRHELKTPITIVRGHLELLDPSDPHEVGATRDLALDELDRMTGLIDGIAALAESRSTELNRTQVRADALTGEIFNKARVIKGHEWILGPTAPSRISVDVPKITQAWLQLVDNAAKYAPQGTPITIGSSESAETVELWVVDVGPGIPPEAGELIFKRFGRADTQRGIAGSGLGLAIVRGIMAAHGGRVIVRSGATGTRIGLEIPRAMSRRS
jgi:signal transduction histidine kinase